MKEFFKKYNWLCEFIAAGALLALTIVLPFEKGVDLVYYLVGSLFLVFSIYRVYPILKRDKKWILRIVFIVEALLFLSLGLTIIVVGSKDPEKAEELKKVLGYLIGTGFFVRGAVFFLGTSVFTESGDWITYFLHLVLLTFGVVIFTRGGFSASALRWAIFGILLAVIIFIVIFGVRHFMVYKKNLDKKKRMEVLKETEAEAVAEEKKKEKISHKEKKAIEEPKPNEITTTETKLIEAEIVDEDEEKTETEEK